MADSPKGFFRQCSKVNFCDLIQLFNDFPFRHSSVIVKRGNRPQGTLGER